MNYAGCEMNTVIIRPRSSGIQKMLNLGAGCGVNMGVFYPRLGCLGLEKITSLLFLCLIGSLFAVGVVILWMRLNWTN